MLEICIHDYVTVHDCASFFFSSTLASMLRKTGFQTVLYKMSLQVVDVGENYVGCPDAH